MASNNYGRGNGDDNPPASQSIPLQDLSRSSDNLTAEDNERGWPSGARGSFLPSRNYTRLADDSSTDISAAGRNPFASPYGSDDDHDAPPVVDDPGAFAQATSGIGLQLHGQSSQSTPSHYKNPYNSSETELHTVPLSTYDSYGPDSYISAVVTNEEDTARLTDQTNLQAISGASTAADQSSTRTIRFENGVSTGSRLGDDLPQLENGFGSRKSRGSSLSRSRSLSPSTSSSAFHRASSMMRSMSQRVVNLSNEPEVIEQSIQKEESWKNSRLEGPPSLPAMTDYAHDAPHRDQITKRRKSGFDQIWRYRNNPLKGKSLYLLAPDNIIRTFLCDVLVHPFTEPCILLTIVVQTILLAIESASSNYAWNNPSSGHWGSGMDYALLVIFIIYTIETISRILVSGFVFNPIEYSTLDRTLPWKQAVLQRGKNITQPHRQLSKNISAPVESQVSIIRTFTGLNQPEEEAVDDDRQRKRVRLAHRAFLRHSFNRLDFVAVVSFWIYFCLSLKGVDVHRLFRMLSCLRILRLLSLTNGTSVILQSLKKAAPLLAHVAFLVGFFWLIFAIVGNQSFKSSLRRTCSWIDPLGQDNYTQNDMYGNPQFCGGYYSHDWQKMSWIKADGLSSQSIPKGYLCPPGSICIEGNSTPFNNTMSFDDILHSLELVFVIMSSNTFSDIMYYTTDSDFLPAALFFSSGILILSLWLVNLLIAVITHSFQVIREESKRSAFAVQKIDEVDTEDATSRKVSQFKRIYDKTAWLWICIILFDLVVMAMRSASMSEKREKFIEDSELVVTLILLVEIILRFASDWRRFPKRRRNWVDLGLAITTCIIQIPAIRNSGRSYSILTIFQVLRIYRVVLAFPMTRNLIKIVFRNTIGLLNLIIFVFLITFLAAIFATQLFRGQIPPNDPDGETITITFSDIYNSFLGMYQILSTENWTTILYNATAYTQPYHTSWISATFFILWFIVANFIVLNMFIAVIQESFDVSEDEKRLHQVKGFLEQKHVGGPAQGNLSLSTIFKFGRDSSRYRDPLDHGPAALDMLLKDAVVREFLDEPDSSLMARRQESMPLDVTVEETSRPSFVARTWGNMKAFVMRREANPFFTRLKVSRDYETLDPKTMAQEVVTAAEQRKRAQREFLMKHPNFNKSLFIFAPYHPVRHFCQRIVGAGRGNQRVEGVEPYKTVWFSFSAFIYTAIVAMVVLACITTPIYQWQNFAGNANRNWFVYTDLGFSILFTVEALIKVIADGFFWTPNAWLRSSWGLIDGVVLVTLWINVVTSLVEDWRVSRIIGAFKALRALRLLNVSDSARNTFHSVVIVGGWNVVSAAAVSLSFLIPFAIYSVNLFNGQLVQCNDDNISGKLTQCVGEYTSSPYNWDVLAPRVASNPYYNFDNFGESLFILFQIVSQEGWIDVQESVMGIQGKGIQPDDLSSTSNGFFFVVFNLLGAVFVLTLFVSVFMRNFAEQTGVAFLTAEQRSWLELRKHLRQISPSKRSVDGKTPQWRKWCYRIAVKKHGRWAKFVTSILILHLILLVLEFYPEDQTWEIVRDAFFFLFTLVFMANVAIRIAGLSWHRFRRSSWDLYAMIAVPGTLTTNILNFIFRHNQAIIELHKLFLVSITLLLIPRNNQLDQLFKTAAASFTAIGNLIATWFVLYLAFAIAMNQIFGLTKFGQNENSNINFRDVPKALVLLFRMSCGEGWNEIMEDFATMVPPYCTSVSEHYYDDCGSAAWARCLFIAWNIISMYIFVSLFVSLIFESFSYVYQQSSGLYAISREEIRQFKQAWATFDPDGTGFITKQQFPRLLGELSGVFRMQVYDNEFMVGRILEQCRLDHRDLVAATSPQGRVVEGVDLDRLSRILDRLPVQVIRERRERLNQFYEEILVSADPVRGISFHTCLMILAHHNVINDSKSLRLEEFLRRRARLQRVDEAVRRSIVIGFFDTLYWSRKFRQRINDRRSARMDTVPQFAIPEIFVDYQEEDNDVNDSNNDGRDDASSSKAQPVMGSSEIATANENDGESSPMLSPTPRSRAHTSPTLRRDNFPPPIDTNAAMPRSGGSSPTDWASFSPSLSRSPHRINNMEPLYDNPREPNDAQREGADQSQQQQDNNDNSMSVQDVMNSLDNSVWGESIRRSFTQRRSGERRSGGDE